MKKFFLICNQTFIEKRTYQVSIQYLFLPFGVYPPKTLLGVETKKICYQNETKFMLEIFLLSPFS